MEKTLQYISSFKQVLFLLDCNEIIFTIRQGIMTFMLLKNGRIRIYNENTNYFLTIEMFQQLFSKENFYLYESEKEETMDSKEKDDEYYSWHRK